MTSLMILNKSCDCFISYTGDGEHLKEGRVQKEGERRKGEGEGRKGREKGENGREKGEKDPLYTTLQRRQYLSII